MPRHVDSISTRVTLNPHNARGQRILHLFRQSKFTHLSDFVTLLLDSLLGKDALLPPIEFSNTSRVYHHLLEEAKEHELSLDEYIRMLLTDRDRNLYPSKGSNVTRNVWYPRGTTIVVPEPVEEKAETSNIDLSSAIEQASLLLDDEFLDGF